MPQIEPGIQQAYWSLGDALARALRAPNNGQAGDPQWTVSGEKTGYWSVSHPDLPLVRDEKGTSKDILLQLHITQQGSSYLVVAQNKTVGPSSFSSPQAVVVAKKETPPGKDWNMDQIGAAAAKFFWGEKAKLQDQAQSVTPQNPPGSMTAPTPPAGGGMPGGPMMASRRERVAKLLVAEIKTEHGKVKCPECGSDEVVSAKNRKLKCYACEHEWGSKR